MKKTAFLMSVVMLLSMLLGIVCSAASASLTIKYMSKSTGKGIAGVEMSVFRVGDVSGEGYTLTEEFKTSGVDLNSLDTTDSKNNAAYTLYSHALNKGINGRKSQTDRLGGAVFGGLSDGIYLVVQSKPVSGYKTILPYLVYIPRKQADGSLLYDVLSNVKTEADSGHLTGDTGGISGGQPGDGSGGGIIIGTCSVTVSKIWSDSDNADKIRPSGVTVNLLENGRKIKSVVLSDENAWKHTFFGLLGTPSMYTVQEETPEGYTAAYAGSASTGFVITNTHTAENPPHDDIAVSVKKIWVDDNDKLGIRPDSVTVQLIKDNTVYRTAQLNKENNWQFGFHGLEDGEYTVKEISPPGYSVSYTRTENNMYTVINTAGEGKDEEPLKPVKPTENTEQNTDNPPPTLSPGEEPSDKKGQFRR